MHLIAAPPIVNNTDAIYFSILPKMISNQPNLTIKGLMTGSHYYNFRQAFLTYLSAYTVPQGDLLMAHSFLVQYSCLAGS